MKFIIFVSLISVLFSSMVANSSQLTHEQMKEKLKNMVPLTHDIDVSRSIALKLHIDERGNVIKAEQKDQKEKEALLILAKAKVINKQFPIKKENGEAISYIIDEYFVELGKPKKEKGAH